MPDDAGRGLDDGTSPRFDGTSPRLTKTRFAKCSRIRISDADRCRTRAGRERLAHGRCRRKPIHVAPARATCPLRCLQSWHVPSSRHHPWSSLHHHPCPTIVRRQTCAPMRQTIAARANPDCQRRGHQDNVGGCYPNALDRTHNSDGIKIGVTSLRRQNGTCTLLTSRLVSVNTMLGDVPPLAQQEAGQS